MNLLSIPPAKPLVSPPHLVGCANRSQFVSISGFDSMLNSIIHGVPQGSVLGPLLFLLYINDLHDAIKYCMVHHFADDTNLLLFDSSLKSLQKKINIDLKILC